MEVIGVIPARYGSTRFEGKVLADIHGKPMVQHVYERASLAKRLDRVLVATEDRRVFDAVKRFGGDVIMTSADHRSGSDRIAEAVADLDVKLVVNVQGDEPMLEPTMIDEVVELLLSKPKAGLATLMKRVEEEEYGDPGNVKVVTDVDGMALYFSRSLIPYPRFRPEGFSVYQHIGIYGYTKEALLRFQKLGPSKLELIEGLEQIRALENGIPVAVRETKCTEPAVCVDTAEDLERVRVMMTPETVKETK